MKKIFKGIAVLAATAAIGTGVAFATGCGGSDGEYEGSYSYVNYGQTYGMSVKVTVKNNIITKVEDTTAELHADWHPVSPGWEDYYDGDTRSAVYTIVTKSGTQIKEDLGLEEVNRFRPNPCTFNVEVAADGTINSFAIATDGSTSGYGAGVPASFQDGSWFAGKKAADILEAFGGDISYDVDGQAAGNIGSNELITGSSQTSFLYLQVAAFASANAAAAVDGAEVADLTEYADVIDLENTSYEVVEGKIPAAPDWYSWTNAQAEYWTTTKAYLLQQYEGWAVADVLAIKVYVKDSGEPYAIKDDHNIARNPELEESGLLVTGATQGSGRLLLAIQDALSKK